MRMLAGVPVFKADVGLELVKKIGFQKLVVLVTEVATVAEAMEVLGIAYNSLQVRNSAVG